MYLACFIHVYCNLIFTFPSLAEKFLLEPLLWIAVYFYHFFAHVLEALAETEEAENYFEQTELEEGDPLQEKVVEDDEETGDTQNRAKNDPQRKAERLEINVAL